MFRYVKYLSTNGYGEGNGVIVGDKLITAAHVVEVTERFSVGSLSVITNASEYYCYNYSWWNRIKNRIFINVNKGWNFDDFAIYPFPSNNSSLTLSDSLPKLGETLKSYYIQHLTSSTDGESWKQCESEAEVIAIRGNFIFCKMSPMLKEGLSGSPLIKEGQVYGILRGGDDKSECWFQSSISIIKHMVNITNNY